MALSNEAVISMVALFIMCVPGVCFLYQLIRRRWTAYGSNRGMILPMRNPNPRSTSSSHVYDLDNAHPREFRFALGHIGATPVKDNAYHSRQAPRHERVDIHQTTMSWSATTFSPDGYASPALG
ncbi:hypothetical protein F5Y04DRAFT_248447 [Hypomontagnella monticulosa]|nr:hypothetical protein F5Y04DRAFT_248447 [Hypomontagnella monticulosa]